MKKRKNTTNMTKKGFIIKIDAIVAVLEKVKDRGEKLTKIKLQLQTDAGKKKRRKPLK